MTPHSAQIIFWQSTPNFSGAPAVVPFDARNDGLGNPEERAYNQCTFNPQTPVKPLWSVIW